MAKIKIDGALYARAKTAAEAAGYSSLEEFVTHIIEKETAKYEHNDADNNGTDNKVADQLRGLGYIE